MMLAINAICESCRSRYSQGVGTFVEDNGSEWAIRLCHRCVPSNDTNRFRFSPNVPECRHCGGPHAGDCGGDH